MIICDTCHMPTEFADVMASQPTKNDPYGEAHMCWTCKNAYATAYARARKKYKDRIEIEVKEAMARYLEDRFNVG